VDTAKATALQAQAAYEIALQHYKAVTTTGTSASLESAKGTLESAKGKYLGAEAQLAYTEIRTPIAGVVTDRPLFAGETPAAGTPVVTVMDTSVMLAKLHVAQSQAQQLKVGAAAMFTVLGLDDPVDATVSLVSPALDPGSTTVEVWLRTPNKDGDQRTDGGQRAAGSDRGGAAVQRGRGQDRHGDGGGWHGEEADSDDGD
jgi:HlyD family secretion protein